MRLASVAGPLLLTFLAVTTTAQNSQGNNITCYGVGGKEYANNYKCPGSNACCGSLDQCLPNRLCKSSGLSDDIFIRGPCSTDPYDEKECAKICVYNERESSKGRFPQVTICEDGSFCCNNDAQCCERGRGTFLDERGNIIDGPESSSSSRSSAPTSAAAASTAANGSPPSETTGGSKPQSSGSDDSLGLKVGLGLGIPLVAIVSGLGVWFFLTRRRRRERLDTVEVGEAAPCAKGESTLGSTYVPSHGPTPQGSPFSGQYQVSEMDLAPRNVHELEGTTLVGRGTAELH
ncbi:hypothetical protein ACHAQH_004748 [Verticillium albo-atrum]